MKKIFVSCLLVYSIGNMAQDTIVKIDNDIIVSKVLKINKAEIVYKKISNLDGPEYSIDKKDVLEIVFENGTVDKISKGKIENSGSTKSLSETKEFIINTIGEYAWEKGSNTRRLKAAFEGDYLHIWVMKKSGNKPVNGGWTYDFSAATSFHPISKRGGGIAFLNIWVPIQKNEKKNTWGRNKLVIEMHNHDAAEQLRLALIRLKELTIENSPNADKF